MYHRITRTRLACALALCLLATTTALLLVGVPLALAASPLTPSTTNAAASTAGTTDSLESAASKAGTTGRQVAMSLIGLGFAVAAVVLSFRRDFKEAAGVFAVGLVAILLATPAGVSLMQDTVNSLFSSQ
jgi:hypothetical protein